MPVQVVPGVGQELAPSIEAFAQGLEKYMKPNHDFQIAMQKAIGGNPELAQRLADTEYNAPGTLARMGFGDLGKVISSIPESEKAQFLRTSRGEILANDKKHLQQDTAQTGFDLDRLNDTINYLKDPNNKAVTADAILHRLTGQTSAQRKHTELESATLEAELPARQAEAGTATAKAQTARQAYESALENLPNLANTDFLATARDFASGKANGATVAALFNTPGANEALSKAIGVVEEERQIALRERLAAERGDKTDDKTLTREAYNAYQQSKFSGTLAAWKTIIGDPAKVEAIKAKKPGDLTQEDKDVIHATDAQRQMQSIRKVSEIRNQNTTVRNAINDISVAKQRNEGLASIQTLVGNLNNILKEKAGNTGETLIAKFGGIPAVGESEPGHNIISGRGTGLYFVDSQGKRVDDSRAVAEPRSGFDGLSTDELQAYTVIKGMSKEERTKALKNMATLRPDVYKHIKGLLNE